ncbi:MAG: hypothetical protein IKW39_06385 [Alphaproteobacteria bacterium]|nr:hypothetical protein [Alphaproteobacteria bacterium]
MKKYYLKTKIKNFRNYLNKIPLTGIKILVILLLLGSCKKIEYVYVTPPKEPINCISKIKTPLDMATCLNEYKLKY